MKTKVPSIAQTLFPFVVTPTEELNDTPVTNESFEGDTVKVDMAAGKITNLKNNKTADINKFTEVQINIYKNGGLL